MFSQLRNAHLLALGPTQTNKCAIVKSGTMHLMYTLDESGNRIYTLKKVLESGKITKSAHPARFSPDDKFSRHRVTVKKRFGVLLTQTPAKPY